jgi:hypothetical protein
MTIPLSQARILYHKTLPRKPRFPQVAVWYLWHVPSNSSLHLKVRHQASQGIFLPWEHNPLHNLKFWFVKALHIYILFQKAMFILAKFLNGLKRWLLLAIYFSQNTTLIADRRVFQSSFFMCRGSCIIIKGALSIISEHIRKLSAFRSYVP